ncbi:RlpA-like double-psi beta-barrel-protein domain-containing protein-containing protein [Aspergillus californicus]
MTTPSPLPGIPKRKPLPSAIVPISDSNSDLEKTPAEVEPAVAPAIVPQTLNAQQPWWHLQSQLQPLTIKWNAFSTKRKRFILIGLVAALALIALIIGLAVGLTQRHGKGSNLPLPTSHGGPYTGDLTYYATGLGSCGITSNDNEKICAVSHVVFDAALTSGNPNENPICGLRLRIRRGESSVDVKVVDRCPGCSVDDLDVSPSVFEELGDLAEGRVVVQWSWLDDTPVSME